MYSFTAQDPISVTQDRIPRETYQEIAFPMRTNDRGSSFRSPVFADYTNMANEGLRQASGHYSRYVDETKRFGYD